MFGGLLKNKIMERLNNTEIKLYIPEVIGSYVKDGEMKDYTKQMLRGDIALLGMDMVSILIKYMNNNGYEDVYITPLITEMSNKCIELGNNYQ